MSKTTIKRTPIILMVDLVPIINNEEVVLIDRVKKPFLNKLVFVGGHFELSDDSLIVACIREAWEEINLRVKVKDLQLLTLLDGKGADPRYERRVSAVYRINFPSREYIKNCVPRSDANKIYIKKIKDLKKGDMGFDHWKVIKLLQKSCC